MVAAVLHSLITILDRLVRIDLAVLYVVISSDCLVLLYLSVETAPWVFS